MSLFAQVARDLRKEEAGQEKRLHRSPKEARSPEPLTPTTTPAADFSFNLDALDNLSLETFAKGREALTIRSEILEDVFLLAPDCYVKRPGDPVAYTVQEVEVLLSLPPEMMKAAHGLKKKLRGRLLTEDEIKKEGL